MGSSASKYPPGNTHDRLSRKSQIHRRRKSSHSRTRHVSLPSVTCALQYCHAMGPVHHARPSWTIFSYMSVPLTVSLPTIGDLFLYLPHRSLHRALSAFVRLISSEWPKNMNDPIPRQRIAYLSTAFIGPGFRQPFALLTWPTVASLPRLGGRGNDKGQ